jgi:transketolase
VSVGPDGATHQAIEDIAIMRVIPNMVVIAPCDVHEARKAVLKAAEYEGPVYIRIARDPSPVVTTPDSPFEIGKAYTFFHKDSAHTKTVGIITTGILAHNALVAAEQLNKEGIGVSVLHMPTIKPLDTQALDMFGEAHDTIVTLEEHQVAGGLGSAISEYYSEFAPKRIIKLGVHDQFGQSGTPDELLKYYGMDTETIIFTVRKLFS